MERKKVWVVFGIIFIGLLLIVASATAQQRITIFDDMEHGDPFGNGWFAFNGTVGVGGIEPNAADLPPIDGGSFSLQTGWGSGGVPGFFGGFGRTNPINLQGKSHFTFWINPDAGQDYTLEINLQDDDNGDDAINPPDDDEFQYNCTISAAGPCALSGGGWQMVSIPLNDFFADNSFLTGGNDLLDPVPVSDGGNGQLINVVIAVISNSGEDVNFRTDNWAFADLIVDDFENGLPAGTDGDGNNIGFFTFQDPNSTAVITTTDSPPDLVPGSTVSNNVLQIDTDVAGNGGFAGVIHAFENDALDTWTPQNWSQYEGFSFWLYGNNTGKTLFIDILDNRDPDNPGDTAERFSIDIVDDFAGWQFFEIPFDSLTRKEVGNGAPNDGLTLTEVHGWAFGVFNAGQPFTNYLDDIMLYGAAELPPLSVAFTLNETEVNEGNTASVAVKLNRPLGAVDDDPQEVSVAFEMEAGSAAVGRDYTPTSGILTFIQSGPSELTFPVETFANPKHDGHKTAIMRLSDPVDVELGAVTQSVLAILDTDPLDATLKDDFERGAYLWQGNNVILNTPEIAAGDPLAVPGQGDYENVLEVKTAFLVDIVVEGSTCNHGRGVIPVALLTTESFDALSVDVKTVRFGDAMEAHVNSAKNDKGRHEEDFDGDGDIDLILHFRARETGYGCDTTAFTLTGQTLDGWPIVYGDTVSFGRDFPIGQDWSGAEAVKFWFHGTNSGDDITLQLKDNRAPDPGPSGWSLVWSDEFDDPVGTPPNPAFWSYQIGDGAVVRNPGWGNSELQYYTDSTDNSAADGAGNLAITAKEADGTPQCYYGACDYTSARLISQYKAEFAYGRIESRIRVPDGEAGLWPAFWSLGTDIDEVGWPQTGEIDFMEYVSRLPNEIFGTIHGPGYAGGASFGDIYDFGNPVSDDFHTFAIEWEPDVIRWYVDGIQYHTATPADVAPNEWVFNDPVYLIFNMAIGGNFGGAVSEDLLFPQELTIDYVRVYQGPDTAERWEATFSDDFEGWQQVVIPFTSLTRSVDQPAGAPDDGLNLNEVWGYGFEMPEEYASGSVLHLDQVRLELIPLVVTNTNDSGSGSLRQALQDVVSGAKIIFDPGLAGGTITLTSGPLVPGKSVTINASDAPGLSLDGGGADRVLIVDSGLTVDLANVTVTNGYGWELAGGILNNGTLNLNNTIVTANIVETYEFDPDKDFWKGGAGIYNGIDATLSLIESTVSNNHNFCLKPNCLNGPDGGGIHASSGSTTTIMRSTISGNSGNVGGGLRNRGAAVMIVNSTFSGNISTGWYGSAIFDTDGEMELHNSTVTENVSPSWGSAAIAIANFGGGPTLTLSNSIVAGNTPGAQCGQLFGASLTLSGTNLFGDPSSCSPGANDIIGDANLGSLSDNGGPTLTHALLAGSPAIDAADSAACPAVDQRGVTRPQGASCDVGSYEYVP